MDEMDFANGKPGSVTIMALDTRTWKTLKEIKVPFEFYGYGGITLQAPPNKRWFALRFGKSLKVFSWDTWQEIVSVDSPDQYQYRKVLFSPDGAFMSADGGVWETSTWKKIKSETERPAQHEFNGKCLAFSADGRYCLARQTAGEITIWQLGAWKAVAAIKTDYEYAHACAFSVDGQYLALAESGGKGRIKIYRCDSWECIRTLERETFDDPSGIAFSPNSKFLGVVYGSKVIKIFSTKSWTLLKSFPAPNGNHEIVFSPDGMCVATYSYGAQFIGARPKVNIWSMVDCN